MNKIDVHADDYGLTWNTSKEILAGVNAGKLDSISVVPNMSAYERCVDLWKKELKKEYNPKVSVHLNFMEGHCLAAKEEVDLLVDERGYFKLSWIDLVKYNYHPAKYKVVKEQLKKEIRCQLCRVIEDYGLLDGKKLRVDSHQHTHMIPMVMKALLEVIEEEKYPTEYIRLSKEMILPYFKQVKFYPTYSAINLVKVAILNFFSMEDAGLLKQKQIPPMILSGVFLSGCMDHKRVKAVLPELKQKTGKKNLMLEVLFHPGTALIEEVGEEFVSQDAKKFYFSAGRKAEYEAMMSLEK